MSQELLDIGFAHDRTTGKEEWLTPPWILQALGKFDLDPCAPVNRPWEIAEKHFTIVDNGLIRPWSGRVFCNPPYGTQTPRWMQRMSEHTGGGYCAYLRPHGNSHILPVDLGQGARLSFHQGPAVVLHRRRQKRRHCGSAVHAHQLFGLRFRTVAESRRHQDSRQISFEPMN